MTTRKKIQRRRQAVAQALEPRQLLAGTWTTVDAPVPKNSAGINDGRSSDAALVRRLGDGSRERQHHCSCGWTAAGIFQYIIQCLV